MVNLIPFILLSWINSTFLQAIDQMSAFWFSFGRIYTCATSTEKVHVTFRRCNLTLTICTAQMGRKSVERWHNIYCPVISPFHEYCISCLSTSTGQLYSQDNLYKHYCTKIWGLYTFHIKSMYIHIAYPSMYCIFCSFCITVHLYLSTWLHFKSHSEKIGIYCNGTC